MTIRSRCIIACWRRSQRLVKIVRTKIQSNQDLAASIVAQGEKVIVFSCFDAPIRALNRHFGEFALTLTGSTPTEKRQALVDRSNGATTVFPDLTADLP
jgi:superfamily II DNA or RNA helicase